MVVKAAEDRLRCDGAETLNRAMERGVLVQRSMSPQLIIIIIGGICAKDSAQVCFTTRAGAVTAAIGSTLLRSHGSIRPTQ